MNLRALKQMVTRNLASIPGWRTDRKIVVIESDDWGSIRMPSRSAYEKLLHSGVAVDRDPYSRYDCLASEDDLTALFEILGSHRGSDGRPAVFTANCVVANPDFDKIRAANFED